MMQTSDSQQSDAVTVAAPRSNLKFRRGSWNAAEFFQGLSRSDVALNEAELESLEPFFWFDLCAEFDALHLHRHLRANSEAYGDDFLAFEQLWFEDEMNHARGFRALYRLLYGSSEAEIDRRLAERKPDFAPLDSFFGDEFRLACLFAYDELATTRAYRVDFELYRRFGPERFLDFIRLLTRDETFHYRNAVELLRRHHRDRFDEIPSQIDDFVGFDLGGHQYRATFLFDHDWGHIESGFFRENGEILKDRLRV